MWILFLFLNLINAAELPASLETVDGRQFAGKLIALDAEGATVETADGRTTLPLADLLEIKFSRDAGNSAKSAATDLLSAAGSLQTAAYVELHDGSAVLARDFYVHKGAAEFHPLAVGDKTKATKISRRHIAAVRLHAAAAKESLDQWNRILKRTSDADAGDLLVVAKDGSLDYHRGVLGDVGETAVDFTLDGETLPVPRRKVFGMVYHRTPGEELPAAVCRLSCSDGSHWSAQTIEFREGLFSLQTLGGAAVSLPLDAVSRLDFSAGKILYLDDLAYESCEWTPYFGGGDSPTLRALFGPQTARNETQEPIRLGDRNYVRGIALHSRTELSYRIPAGFTRFRAAAGIDDRVRPAGNVRLIISGDDRPLFDKTLRGVDPPLDLDLDLGEAKTLRILVDYGDDLDTADHLGLGDARLMK